MQIGTYLTKQISSDTYTFNSIGPKGIIELRIIISKDDREASNYHNLAFGVWNKILNDIDDKIELKRRYGSSSCDGSSNSNFIYENHPQSLLYIEGSNSIRTRKYQMGISKDVNNIPPSLGILGLIDENLLNEALPALKWEHFRRNTNYHAFLLYTK
ncbi:DUF6934 family protein [Dyadobacter subterraneus]|uniref:Uncharacterized protein n=1 Tax=Dyadobacter subterraneus TaxID=2773304 RepID=A0ABR9WHP1_9BACT|nr:hypothetical protein [Dyadobacter subterraneus]MBE9464619.1 hypothetical protein [Dyadobacter subterraneus]